MTMSSFGASTQQSPPSDDRKIVGISDLNHLRGAGRLVTYSLGSCVAVCLYHPMSHTGFLCHYLLAQAEQGDRRRISEPLMFGSVCVNMLLDLVSSHGIAPGHCHIAVAGGAALYGGDKDHFGTGEKNVTVAMEILKRRSLRPDVVEVGGRIPRTVTLDVESGELKITSPNTPARVFNWKI